MKKEDIHYCEPEDGIEERLVESLVNSWESLDQQKNVLKEESMGDENPNVFEINEFCMFAGVTGDEPCEFVP